MTTPEQLELFPPEALLHRFEARGRLETDMHDTTDAEHGSALEDNNTRIARATELALGIRRLADHEVRLAGDLVLAHAASPGSFKAVVADDPSTATHRRLRLANDHHRYLDAGEHLELCDLWESTRGPAWVLGAIGKPVPVSLPLRFCRPLEAGAVPRPLVDYAKLDPYLRSRMAEQELGIQALDGASSVEDVPAPVTVRMVEQYGEEFELDPEALRKARNR